MSFKKHLQRADKNLEINREVQISDTSKRYTLHVQKNGKHRYLQQVSVNINGTDWLKPRDLLLKKEFIQNTLLLNANNAMRVRLHGKPGASVTITLVEGGAAGTVLNRRGFLGLPKTTQDAHRRQNDINIFDPDNEDSLGGLEPYVTNPLSNSSAEFAIEELLINGEHQYFEAKTLLLSFENSETDLPLFLDRYDARVIRSLQTSELGIEWYYVEINPDTLPLSQSGELLRFFEALLNDPESPPVTDFHP